MLVNDGVLVVGWLKHCRTHLCCLPIGSLLCWGQRRALVHVVCGFDASLSIFMRVSHASRYTFTLPGGMHAASA